jgi:hypothetical protein
VACPSTYPQPMFFRPVVFSRGNIKGHLVEAPKRHLAVETRLQVNDPTLCGVKVCFPSFIWSSPPSSPAPHAPRAPTPLKHLLAPCQSHPPNPVFPFSVPGRHRHRGQAAGWGARGADRLACGRHQGVCVWEREDGVSLCFGVRARGERGGGEEASCSRRRHYQSVG